MPNPHSELSARAAAALVIAAVLHQGESLRTALNRVDLRIVDPRDRGLLRELCFGVLRFLPSLRAQVVSKFTRALKPADAPLEALLLVGLYQLKTATQPAYAIVHATTECARELGFVKAAGFVNAILRGLQREGWAPFDFSGRSDHPDWLIKTITHDWPQQVDDILRANMAHAPMWLRVNAQRLSAARYAEGIDPAPTPSPLAPHALKLGHALPIDALPGFAEGQVSVQDLSAQLAVPLLDVQPGMRVLDACAAPGGKTAQLLETSGNDLALLALDPDARRLNQVADTLARLGLSAQLAVADARNPAAWFDGVSFDRILIDAPCSGFGVIRRHPDIKTLRRHDDLQQQVQLQREILDALWPTLAPGGKLLYATCSFQKAENEQQIAAFLGRHDTAELLALPDIGINTGFGRQRFPGDDDGDGFFYALLAKRA